MYNLSDMYCRLTECSQALPQDPFLAYSYVPKQCLGSVYSHEKALCRGTLFPDLDKPMNVYGYEFKEKCEKEDNCEKEEVTNCKCGGDTNE